MSSGFRRVTTEIVLRGGGLEGRGEDVTYAAEDHDAYPAELPLAGEWTLDGFSRHLGGLDLFPDRPPQQEFFRHYRRWGFESAALDLALRQRRLSLGAALGRPYAPVRFVLSTRLDITPWLAVDPELEFKLDPTPEWDEALMRDIAATGRVRALDFKAFYEGSPVDNPPDPEQYRLVSRRSRTPCSRTRRCRARRARRCAGRRPGSASTPPSTPGRTSRPWRNGWPRPAARSARCVRAAAAQHQAVALRQPERAAGLRRARAGRRHGALRRRPVRARHRPRPDPGAGQPVVSRRPERRGAARISRRGAPRRAAEPAAPLAHQGAGFGFAFEV